MNNYIQFWHSSMAINRFESSSLLYLFELNDFCMRINKLQTLSMWQPLSRLSHAIYSIRCYIMLAFPNYFIFRVTFFCCSHLNYQLMLSQLWIKKLDAITNLVRVNFYFSPEHCYHSTSSTCQCKGHLYY